MMFRVMVNCPSGISTVDFKTREEAESFFNQVTEDFAKEAAQVPVPKSPISDEFKAKVDMASRVPRDSPIPKKPAPYEPMMTEAKKENDPATKDPVPSEPTLLDEFVQQIKEHPGQVPPCVLSEAEKMGAVIPPTDSVPDLDE